MPFGSYTDFKDCVARNQDKSNPEAYCAAVHKKITGRFPTEQAPTEKTGASEPTILKGVEVFYPGKHKDSLGHSIEYTTDNLRAMLEAFSSGVPPEIPIKLGHTSETFNDQVAEALGIPTEVLVGEAGLGAARLGKVIGLHLNGCLVADMELHPKVASLIDQHLFTGVSVEIQPDREQDGKNWGSVLSAIALLGAQRPSLANLNGIPKTHSELIFIHKFQEPDWAKTGIPMEGSVMVPSGAATSPDPGAQKIWEVPVMLGSQAGQSRLIQAMVSAPSEVSAKRTALRVVENFLLSATSPLGQLLGGALGTIFSWRILTGQPLLKRGPIGLLRWRFTEPQSQEEAMSENQYQVGTLIRVAGKVGGKIARVVARRKKIAGWTKRPPGKIQRRILAKLINAITSTPAGKRGLERSWARVKARRAIKAVPSLRKPRARLSEGVSPKAYQDYQAITSPGTIGGAGTKPAGRISRWWTRRKARRTLQREVRAVLRDRSEANRVKREALITTLREMRAGTARIEKGQLPEGYELRSRKPTARKAYQEGQPSKEWWDRCMSKAATLESLTDPAAFCGSVWFHNTPIPRDSFQEHPGQPDTDTQTLDRLVKQWYAEYQQEEVKMREELIALLELPEDATDEDIVAAVKELVEAVEEEGDEEEETPAEEGGSSDDNQHMAEEITALTTEIATLKQRLAISQYTEQATSLTIIQGTPKELGTRLATLESKAGKETAEALLAEWQRLQKFAESQGFGAPALSAAESPTSDFMSEVAKYQEAHPDITRTEVIKLVAKHQPSLWRDYTNQVRAGK